MFYLRVAEIQFCEVRQRSEGSSRDDPQHVVPHGEAVKVGHGKKGGGWYLVYLVGA